MPIAGIIWDFDGVVVFTPHFEAWKRACEDYGIRGFDERFYDEYVSGLPRYEGAYNILSMLGGSLFSHLTDEELKKKAVEFGDYKNEIFNKLIDAGVFKLNHEALKLLAEARRLGVLNVLASASRNAARIAYMAKVENFKLIEFFDYDVSGSGHTKREVFWNAYNYLKSRGVHHNCIIVIEDSPKGAEAGKSLGLYVVGYARNEKLFEALKNAGANLVVRSLTDVNLVSILKELRCFTND